ncbi:MAG: hypothetical protein ACOZE5_02495 [Verrucomicrobiota bacterium]
MTRHRIRHVPPLRFGLVLAVINGFAGMILAPLFLITLGIAFTATESGVVIVPKAFPAVPWFLAGGLAVFTPFINAVGGFLAGVLIATVYNFSARWTGGIEFHTEDSER